MIINNAGQQIGEKLISFRYCPTFVDARRLALITLPEFNRMELL